jgi:hypothetical protein
VTKWEYRVITINTAYSVKFGEDLDKSPPSDEVIRRHLKPMGEDGWELASFIPSQPAAQNWNNTPANPWMYHAVFKRPLED